MKKILTISILMMLMATGLYSFSDADMDGVDDSVDRCPNTPLSDLVDIYGCTKEHLEFQDAQIPQGYFDFIVGANYTGANYSTNAGVTDTYSTTLQMDYYYKKLSLQASTGYYRSAAQGYDEKGMTDTFVGSAYSVDTLHNMMVRFGIGALLPTYETTLGNNKTDYSATLNLGYTLGKFNFFGGYSYTKINDDDLFLDADNAYLYQDVQGMSGGLGYQVTPKFYMSGAYSTTKSLYKEVRINGVAYGVADIQTLTWYGYVALFKESFLMLNYVYGLSRSASKHAASLSLGFYF